MGITGQIGWLSIMGMAEGVAGMLAGPGSSPADQTHGGE